MEKLAQYGISDAQLERAHEIEKAIDKLIREQNDLLDPLCKVLGGLGVEELTRIIDLLPAGFHRSELRVIRNLAIRNNTPDGEKR